MIHTPAANNIETRGEKRNILTKLMCLLGKREQKKCFYYIYIKISRNAYEKYSNSTYKIQIIVSIQPTAVISKTNIKWFTARNSKNEKKNRFHVTRGYLRQSEVKSKNFVEERGVC